mmetsp:Transcript_77815/g.141539  ORF Transcript_77815/g.141539 Transcript_77815/m.141539 type:complete len:96 (-) Transcript_77815:129-416(-)
MPAASTTVTISKGSAKRSEAKLATPLAFSTVAAAGKEGMVLLLAGSFTWVSALCTVALGADPLFLPPLLLCCGVVSGACTLTSDGGEPLEEELEL